ncbi:MAG: hypothetical protein ACI9AT_000119 [Ulvibacter sp.]|jgi:hypothetical protein
MKKIVLILAVATVSLSSCMINTHVIGDGGATESTRSKSYYVLGNRISEADSKALAGGAENYSIDTRTNFVDMLLRSFTGGLVSSRTVIIKK